MKVGKGGGGIFGKLLAVVTGSAVISMAPVIVGLVSLVVITQVIGGYTTVFQKKDESVEVVEQCPCGDCSQGIELIGDNNGTDGGEGTTGTDTDNSIGGDYSGTHNSGSLSFASGNIPGLSEEASNNAKQIYTMFMKEGFSSEATCGILGNMRIESAHTFNPRIYKGGKVFVDLADTDSTSAWGLIQADNGARTAFKNIAANTGLNPNTVDGQVQVIVQYMHQDTTSKGIMKSNGLANDWDDFKSLNDPELAADYYLISLERAVWNPSKYPSHKKIKDHAKSAINGKEYQGITGRKKYAKEFYAYFSQNTTSSSGNNTVAGANLQIPTQNSNSNSNKNTSLTNLLSTGNAYVDKVAKMKGLSGYRWGIYPIEFFTLSCAYERGTSEANILKCSGDGGKAYTMMQLDYRYDLVPAMKQLYSQNSLLYAGFMTLQGYTPGHKDLIGNRKIIDGFNSAYKANKVQYAADVTQFFFNEYTVECIKNFEKAGISLEGRHFSVLAAATSCAVNKPAAARKAIASMSNSMTDEQMIDIIYQKWQGYVKAPRVQLGKTQGGEWNAAICLLKGEWIPSTQDSPAFVRSNGAGWDYRNSVEMAGGTPSGSSTMNVGNSVNTPGQGTGGVVTNVKLHYSKENVDIDGWTDGTPIDREYKITSCEPLVIKQHLLTNPIYSQFNSSKPIQGFVVHYWYGSGSSGDNLYSLFNNNNRKNRSSANFCMGSDGVIWQFVPLDKAGWASDTNENRLSIEVSNIAKGQYAEASYKSLVHFVAYMAVQYNLSTDFNWMDNKKGNKYRDLSDIYRHYDSPRQGQFRGKGCPLYWTPKDGSSENDNIATAGGNARWIAFKEDVTEFIIKYKDDPNFVPQGEIAGSETIAQYKKPDSNANWKNGTWSNGVADGSINTDGKVYKGVGCGCDVPCPYCDCHDEDYKRALESGDTSNKIDSNNTSDNNASNITGVTTGVAQPAGTVVQHPNAQTYKVENNVLTWTGNNWNSTVFMLLAQEVMREECMKPDWTYSDVKKHYECGHTGRTDCSGYVSHVLQHLGYTNEIYNTEGLTKLDSMFGFQKVGYDEMQTGDIVVWRGGDDHHTCIFVEWENSEHTRFLAFDYGGNVYAKLQRGSYHTNPNLGSFVEPISRGNKGHFRGAFRVTPRDVTINGKEYKVNGN